MRNNLYLVAPVASPLSSIKDIRDHKVSIFRGTNGHLVAINVLAAHGPSERDIKGVNLDGQRPGRAGVQRWTRPLAAMNGSRCATRPG